MWEREEVLPVRERGEVVYEPSRGAPMEILAAPGMCRVCPVAREWATERVGTPAPSETWYLMRVS